MIFAFAPRETSFPILILEHPASAGDQAAAHSKIVPDGDLGSGPPRAQDAGVVYPERVADCTTSKLRVFTNSNRRFSVFQDVDFPEDLPTRVYIDRK